PPSSTVGCSLRPVSSVPLLLPHLACCSPSPPLSTLFPYTTLFRSQYFRVYSRDIHAAYPDRAAGHVPQSRCQPRAGALSRTGRRSEEHTSELQSRFDQVCRPLLE